MKNIIISVKDMSCEHCKKTLETSLNNLNGVKKVLINLDDKLININYDEHIINYDKIEGTIKVLGYIPILQ
jgi:copper chaperone